eukprot:gene17977-23609_t
MDNSHISSEIELLKEKIIELGIKQEDGKIAVQFGVLYNATVDIFEALNGTLRAAKSRKVIDFKGQMLLKGANDNVMITLL